MLLNAIQYKRRGYALRSFAQRGFTIIELMVTLTLGAVLMVIAVPSFVQFQRNAQLSDAVSSFITAANTARASAMKQGLNTYLIPNTGTSWSSGWMVYTDANWNQAYNVDTTDEIVLRHEAISADVTITAPGTSSLSSGYLLFNGSGYPKLNSGSFSQATIVINNNQRSSSVIIDLAGRVRSCQTGTTGC